MADEFKRGCALNECGTESACKGCNLNKSEQASSQPLKHQATVRKVIGIVSGKGGVGKSLISSEIAVMLQRMGYRVGILDADITGPSVPHMFGVHEKAFSDGKHIFPIETSTGIRLISINLMLEQDDDPIVWRGPVIASAVKQFWKDVDWGELDIMVIDMPPGTGDVPLTIFQSIPLNGIIVVSTPQDLVSMIVRKAISMAKLMNIPVLGLIENMSYALCPNCGKHIELFGRSHIAREAANFSLPVLAQLPLDPTAAALCDAGAIETLDNPLVADATKIIVSHLGL